MMAMAVPTSIFLLLAAARPPAAASFRVPQTLPALPTRAPSEPESPSLISIISKCSPSARAIVSRRHHAPASTALRGLFDDGADSSDNGSRIPPELRDEIYLAESNTPAARGRRARVVAYVALTLAGVTTAFFNAFLSDLRFGEGSPSDDLAYYGFGWVEDSLLLNFAFTNKIGGALGLLGAGLSGTLAEVEIRSKKENAEKIWEEMQRRKSLKDKPSRKEKKKRGLVQSSKRDMTGKQKKRMSALEELMVEDEPPTAPQGAESSPDADGATAEEKEGDDKEEEEAEGGVLGAIKGFYKRADSMAASQALLLNKELEDRGVIEKITDESGLKVIGKEAASKLRRDGEEK